MYDQATIDIFKDLTAITLRFQYQAYAMTFIVDEENAVHPSLECRFYGFNIRAVSE